MVQFSGRDKNNDKPNKNNKKKDGGNENTKEDKKKESKEKPDTQTNIMQQNVLPILPKQPSLFGQTNNCFLSQHNLPSEKNEKKSNLGKRKRSEPSEQELTRLLGNIFKKRKIVHKGEEEFNDTKYKFIDETNIITFGSLPDVEPKGGKKIEFSDSDSEAEFSSGSDDENEGENSDYMNENENNRKNNDHDNPPDQGTGSGLAPTINI